MIDGVSLVILVEDDDDVDWVVRMTSETNSLEREIELVVWIVVSVDNVDCNELSSDSETVTISDGVVSIDDWLTIVGWETVIDTVDSDSEIVPSSSAVVVDVTVWLVLWTILVGVILTSVSDMVSKVKKIVVFKKISLSDIE